MNEEFEKLDSVEEMLSYIAENKEDSMHLGITQELQLLGVQAFLRLFGQYKTLKGAERHEFEQCATVYNDMANSPITRQSALVYICSIFFPERETFPAKEISRKNDSKAYQTPCEDCNSTPTHLLIFKTENRTEEHFLCESCEETARVEEGDE